MAVGHTFWERTICWIIGKGKSKRCPTAAQTAPLPLFWCWLSLSFSRKRVDDSTRVYRPRRVESSTVGSCNGSTLVESQIGDSSRIQVFLFCSRMDDHFHGHDNFLFKLSGYLCFRYLDFTFFFCYHFTAIEQNVSSFFSSGTFWSASIDYGIWVW